MKNIKRRNLVIFTLMGLGMILLVSLFCCSKGQNQQWLSSFMKSVFVVPKRIAINDISKWSFAGMANKLIVYPDISFDIPAGYDYAPKLNWWADNTENATPSASYRSIPVGTSRQFRAIFVDSSEKSSNPLDNSNLVWGIQGYVPPVLNCSFYASKTSGGKKLRMEGAFDDVGKDINAEITTATGIEATKVVSLSKIDPTVNISYWYQQDGNNVWTLGQSYQALVSTGFCNLNNSQLKQVNDYLKNKTYNITTESAIPLTFNGNDIATIDNTGLVQMNGGTSAVIALKLLKSSSEKDIIASQHFVVRAITNTLTTKVPSKFHVFDIGNTTTTGNIDICPSTNPELNKLHVGVDRIWDPIWMIKQNDGLKLEQTADGWIGTNVKEDLARNNVTYVGFTPNNLRDKEILNITAFSLSNPSLQDSLQYRFRTNCSSCLK